MRLLFMAVVAQCTDIIDILSRLSVDVYRHGGRPKCGNILINWLDYDAVQFKSNRIGHFGIHWWHNTFRKALLTTVRVLCRTYKNNNNDDDHFTVSDKKREQQQPKAASSG